MTDNKFTDIIDTNTNAEFLKIAADVMSNLDVTYMQADLDMQLELRDDLDRAMRRYAKIRLAILKRQVICTAQDIVAMQTLQQNLAKATGQRQLLDVFLGFVGFLTTRFF
jgi:hypothetical protein